MALGALIDEITILEIKIARVSAPALLQNIRRELERCLNELLGSEIREEKAYAHFQTDQTADQN